MYLQYPSTIPWPFTTSPPLPWNFTWLGLEYVSHFLFYICICSLVCFQFSLPSTMSLLHLNLYDFDVHCTIAQRCCTWSIPGISFMEGLLRVLYMLFFSIWRDWKMKILRLNLRIDWNETINCIFLVHQTNATRWWMDTKWKVSLVHRSSICLS